MGVLEGDWYGNGVAMGAWAVCCQCAVRPVRPPARPRTLSATSFMISSGTCWLTAAARMPGRAAATTPISGIDIRRPHDKDNMLAGERAHGTGWGR